MGLGVCKVEPGLAESGCAFGLGPGVQEEEGRGRAFGPGPSVAPPPASASKKKGVGDEGPGAVDETVSASAQPGGNSTPHVRARASQAA